MLERMEDFFVRRVEEYDEHMLYEVEGCEEGYRQMATLVPSHTLNLLDLGCGTGLELQAIWEKKPDIMVYAIDLCPQMLEKLKEKYADKNMTVVCGDYFRHPFGRNHFDVAVSFESFHHFVPVEKFRLYRKIWASLRKDGLFLLGDYMVRSTAEEEKLREEDNRLRQTEGRSREELLHSDIPLTVNHEKELLRKAGFCHITEVWHKGNTVLLQAQKGE